MRIKDIIETDYQVPLNLSAKNKLNYEYIIASDYAKYIAVIVNCSGACMYRQFVEMVELFDFENGLTKSGYVKRANRIIDKLIAFGFIKTGFFNRYKYIVCKHPAVAIVEGDYKTHKRVSTSILFKSNNFMKCVAKIQLFIEKGIIYEYSEIFNQLMLITNKIYAGMSHNGNPFGYDLLTARKILTASNFDDVTNILDANLENNHRLGIMRVLWDELSKSFISLYKKNIYISDTPVLLTVYVQKDGYVTLHYVPCFVVFDIFKGMDYYKSINTILSKALSRISVNDTLCIKEEFIKNRKLGSSHFNRIGYDLTLIIADSSLISKKIDILNEPYRHNGSYVVMLTKCKSIIIDINEYFKEASVKSSNSKMFESSVSKLDRYIEERIGEINEL